MKPQLRAGSKSEPIKQLTDKVKTTQALAQHIAQAKVKRAQDKNPFAETVPKVSDVTAKVKKGLDQATTELSIFLTDPPKTSAKGPAPSRQPHPVEARLLQATQKLGDVVTSPDHRMWAHESEALKLSLEELVALSLHQAKPDGPRDAATFKGILDDAADIKYELALLRKKSASATILSDTQATIAERLALRLATVDVARLSADEFSKLEKALSETVEAAALPAITKALVEARLRACSARLANVTGRLGTQHLDEDAVEIALHLNGIPKATREAWKAALAGALSKRLAVMSLGTLSKDDTKQLSKTLGRLRPVPASVIELVCVETLSGPKPDDAPSCDRICLDVENALIFIYQIDNSKDDTTEHEAIAKLLPACIAARFKDRQLDGGHAKAKATVLEIFRKKLATDQLCIPLIGGLLSCQTVHAASDSIADLQFLLCVKEGPKNVLPSVVSACHTILKSRLESITPLASVTELTKIAALLRSLKPKEAADKLAVDYLVHHVKALESDANVSNTDVTTILALLSSFPKGAGTKAASSFLEDRLAHLRPPTDGLRLHFLLDKLGALPNGAAQAGKALSDCLDSTNYDLAVLDADLQVLNTCLGALPLLSSAVAGPVCWTLQQRIAKSVAKPTQAQLQTLLNLVAVHVSLTEHADDLKTAMLQIFLQRPADPDGQTELQSLMADLPHVLGLVTNIDSLRIDWGVRLGSVDKDGYAELPRRFTELVDHIVDNPAGLGPHRLQLLKALIVLHRQAPALHVIPNPSKVAADFPCTQFALPSSLNMDTIFLSAPLTQAVLFGKPEGMGPAKPAKGSGHEGEFSARYGEYMHGDGAQSGKNRLTVGYIKSSGTFVLILEPPSNSGSGHSQKSHQMAAYDAIQNYKARPGLYAVVDSPLRLYLRWRGVTGL